jgi:hypothetical protein
LSAPSGSIRPVRDYQRWHEQYDDPASPLSWRLGRVQHAIGAALDARSGPVRVLSVCSGDGRDLLGVLSRRDDADRVCATLVEIHPAIAERARAAATRYPGVEVRTADAGDTSAFIGAVPADLVLLVGIFGNITDADREATIAATPQLCAAQATVVWTRSVGAGSGNENVRAEFRAAGFVETSYEERGGVDGPAVGVVRFAGTARPLVEGRRLFTFVR